MEITEINVVKIGGNVIDNPSALADFIGRFAKLPGPKVLVHGGGKEATRLSKALGIETIMIEGRRVTDRDTIDVVTMTYAGLINKRIVAMLQAEGCDALGFSGADGGFVKATKRVPNPIDYGYVGDINPNDVNVRLLKTMFKAGITPVMCAICHDGMGQLLNCNADSVASAISLGCSRIATTVLTYCFEKAGVLKDIEDDKSLIPLITEENFDTLKADGTIARGMIPKLHNALEAARNGVAEVRICKAENLLNTTGTIVKLASRR